MTGFKANGFSEPGSNTTYSGASSLGHFTKFVAFLAILTALATRPEPAYTVQIWFAPRQDIVDMTQPPGHRISFDRSDFAKFIASDNLWHTAASRTALVTINAHTIEQFGDLSSVVSMVARHKFQVATAGGFIFTDGECAQEGIEGLDRSKEFAREIVSVIRKWKQSGGRLEYSYHGWPVFFWLLC